MFIIQAVQVIQLYMFIIQAVQFIQLCMFIIQTVRVIQLAVSLGGVESLIEHPATMTHGPMIMSDADRAESLITEGLVRLR